MYELKIITHFSAAHQLKDYEGPCEALHGHNWKIEVCVTAEALDKADMALDFKVLKERLSMVLAPLDHRLLNEIPPFDSQNPSSENIARHIAEQLQVLLRGENVEVSRVTAWESESACATYYPPNPPPKNRTTEGS